MLLRSVDALDQFPKLRPDVDYGPFSTTEQNDITWKCYSSSTTSPDGQLYRFWDHVSLTFYMDKNDRMLVLPYSQNLSDIEVKKGLQAIEWEDDRMMKEATYTS